MKQFIKFYMIWSQLWNIYFLKNLKIYFLLGFPGGNSDKKIHLECRRCKRIGFDLWVRKISGRRKWQPCLVFLPGQLHGQRSLVGYSPWSHKELDVTEHARAWLSLVGGWMAHWSTHWCSIPITGLSCWWSSTMVAILLCKLHKDTRVLALRCTLETGRVFCQTSVWLFHTWVDSKKAAWRRGHKTWEPENLYLNPGLATKEWWDFCLTYTLHLEFLVCKVRGVDWDDLWSAFGL